MIGAIPPEYFELVEEIFEKAKKEYGFLPKEKETLALLIIYICDKANEGKSGA